MKTIIKILFVTILSICSMKLSAQDTTKVNTTNPDQQQKQHQVRGFVDENNDGFNDNAPDDDGDGIPNGLDPDYVKNKNKERYIDLDGDGINDYLQNRKGMRGRKGRMNNSVEPQTSETQQTGTKNGNSDARQKRKGKGNR